MRTLSSALRAALFSDEIDWLVKLTIGAVTIDRSRILRYHVHEYGRLGRADLEVVIDNADGAAESAISLEPGQDFISSEGAIVAGVETYVQRHKWYLQQPLRGAWRDYSDTITLIARNGAHLFNACPATNVIHHNSTVGDILTAIVAPTGLTLSLDASGFWDHVLRDFTVAGRLPLAVALGSLVGGGSGTYARALAHFSADGATYYFESLTGNTIADDTLGTAGDTRVYEIDARVTLVPTRINVRGHDATYPIVLYDLETLQGSIDYESINLPQLLDRTVEDRAEQEALEILARREQITFTVDPHIGLELHDTLQITNLSAITDNSKWRVIDIDLRYESSLLKMIVTARSLATSLDYSAVIGFDPATAPDTLVDNFDTYGGDIFAQSGNTGLHWLSILECDGDADESYTWISLDATHVAQGSTAGYCISSAPSGLQNRVKKVYAALLDFTQDGRFGDDDYVTLWAHVGTPGGVGLLAWYFIDTNGKQAYADFSADIVAGANFFKTKRSDLAVQGGFDWTQIVSIDIVMDSNDGAANLYVDDVRIAKADPDDADTFNDTGRAWNFDGGVWHIYQDVPNVLYALGQIDDTSTARKTAIRAGEYSAASHFATGIYLRAAGAAGLLALALDEDNGYEIKIDSAANTVSLLRWTAGVSTLLGTAAVTIDPLVVYYVGLVRDGLYLRVYVSTSPNIFRSPSLLLHVADSTYLAGRCGLVSYGVNSRFFHVRAGSPEHALSAEYAFEADTVDGYHAADLALVANGVTNGDSHDHNGGDGAQIDHVNLANKGTNTHAQIDTHLGAASPHSGHYKSGDAIAVDSINVGSASGAASGEVLASGAIKSASIVSGYMPFTVFTLSTTHTAATNTHCGAVAVAGTFRRWLQWVYVATTNDASNYWTITLKSAAGTTIKVLTTQSSSANTWTALSDQALNAAAAVNTFYVTRVEKVGSPGAIQVACPAVYVE